MEKWTMKRKKRDLQPKMTLTASKKVGEIDGN